MGANVMCLTMGGGIPLFTRTKGKVEAIPFSAIASLYGVHTYGKSQGTQFLSTKTGCNTVVWKEFNEAVILIAVSLWNDETILNYLLEAVFSAMVLIIGLEEIKNMKSVERMKRELRACYPLIEKLMDCLDFSDKNVYVDLMYYTESVKTTDYEMIKTYLDIYADSCSSEYACLTIDNCVTVATNSWYTLSPTEKKLITYLISTNNSCTCFDIPVFLPQKNPSVCVRAVCIRLSGRICCTVLCGPEPDLITAQQYAYEVWLPIFDTIQSLRTNFPPANIHLHSSLLGFLLIDLSLNRYIYNMFSPMNRKDGKSSGEILKTFYYQAAHTLAKKDNICHETYWCSEYHKVHALRHNDLLICVLYTPSVPTHAIRSITAETLDLLTDDPQMTW